MQMSDLAKSWYLLVNLISGEHAQACGDKFVEKAEAAGVKFHGTFHAPANATGPIDIQAKLDFNVLASNARVCYLIEDVSQFVIDYEMAVKHTPATGNLQSANAYWWGRRYGRGDVIVDRNLNIFDPEEITKVTTPIPGYKE